MAEFTHLHVHTQYSLLDGASDISSLLSKVKEYQMKAIAITDHGSMFGVKEFHEYASKYGIKPIIGCETYVASSSRFEKKGSDDRSGYHLILLAKNKVGYHNLVRLISYAWTEGFYYKPRIDMELLRKYNEGLIATSACLGGEIPQHIMSGNFEKAEEAILQFKEIFKDDYYLELMRHHTGNPERDRDVYDNQRIVNAEIVKLAKKLDVKLVASNDCHFLNKDDADAHDILVCMNTGKDYSDANRMHYTGQEYLKTPDEMAKIFADIPEAVSNTMEIADKVEVFKLDRNVLLPEFPLPPEFTNQDDYLKYLTFEGAKTHYDELTPDIKARLDYELEVVKNMGFAGYFLIVQDFIAAARNMGVSVGPGRGSAAGSAVAFCVGITNIDPIRYKLLFERFLNPERVSMPDIDIDFDEDGREHVLKWVVNKYGKDRVAHIVTFGTMAPKMSIKDVGRVLNLPLPEANRLTKLVPEKPGTTFKQAFQEVPELSQEKKSDNELIRKTLTFAETLEGCIRHTGTHACGIIIGPEDLVEHIPLCTAKDTDLLVTQYEGKYVESVGMLKMDFLGLKTLSIIKDAVENVYLSKGIQIDIDKIPIDDPKTFELYQKGETVGTFQFESSGMRMYLKDLKPSNIEDLFAMNALYRPGPMDFIPSYIKRKHGQEKVEYPHEMLIPLLKDTYGIMIYQEQIMQAAQIMASYSLGAADILRRAMGKKKPEEMAKQKSVFIAGAMKNGVTETNAAEVFSIMEGFASYGFNRSHSAAYSVVAFQTAYLKANYPGEYMAALLSRNLNDIKKITIFMDECKRMGLPVLGPDVNESFMNFTVNKSGALRFGLGGIKSVGEAAVMEIIANRKEKGPLKNIYEFVERVNSGTVSKRTFEALALAGAFDSFKEVKRSQYFAPVDNENNYLEALLKYGSKIQNDNRSTVNLFSTGAKIEVKKPDAPICEDWSQLEKLNKERELIGIYLSSHPLDVYKIGIQTYCNTTLGDFQEMQKLNGKEIKVAGMVTAVEHKTTKTGNPFGSITIEDFTDSYKITFFSKEYLDFKKYFTVGYALLLRGKTQKRFGDEKELEFKPTSIELLSDVKEKMIQSLAIKIPIDQLSDELIIDLQQLADQNKGKTELKFVVYDPSTKIWVQMASKSYKINVTEQIMEFLQSKQPALEYKVF